MEAVELATAGRTRVAMVWPNSVVVLAPIADLRAAPDDGAELVDQVHHGEQVRVLGAQDAWRYVQADDHYLGWIRPGTILDSTTRYGASRIVAVALAPIHRERDAASEVVGRLPAGTQLPQYRPGEDLGPWARIHIAHAERTLPRALIGYVSIDDTVLQDDLPHRPPTADDLLRTAEGFLGVPYLWGGTTALGLDCSGFVQQVYRLNGIRLDRDADQQATEGRPVESPRAGDLIFWSSQQDPPGGSTDPFGEPRITHVALATGERTFLHAPQRGGAVERSALSPERAPRAIRRYLAEPARVPGSSQGDPPGGS